MAQDTPTPKAERPAMEAQAAADDVERRDVERRRKIAAALRGNKNAAGKRTRAGDGDRLRVSADRATRR
jgi:hypothetical protein